MASDYRSGCARQTTLARNARRQAPGRAQALVTLYVGTEKGLTYRLMLVPAERASAQILIRSYTAAGPSAASPAGSGGARKSEIAALIGAVARRDPPPGYAVVSGPVRHRWPGSAARTRPHVLFDAAGSSQMRPVSVARVTFRKKSCNKSMAFSHLRPEVQAQSPGS